ncbi:MAG TPA: FUSC family protein [Terracidiphilus sp.]|nr:FUSC family protein [Terracidiphilus sp.]
MNRDAPLLIRAFWQDQQPSAERIKCVLRIVLASVITLVCMLVWQMPYLPLCLYILFFVAHESPAICFKFNMAMLVTGTIAVATSLVLIGLTGNDPMARVLSIAAIGFVCGMGIQACAIPFLFVGLGFVFVTLIAMWELHAPADTLVKNSLWFIASLSVALGSSLAVEYLFGVRDPAADLRKQIAMRYRALQKLFSFYAEGAITSESSRAVSQVARFAAAGPREILALYETVVARNLDPGDLRIGTKVRMTLGLQLLDLSAAFAAQNPETVDPELRGRCAAIAAHCGALADLETTVPSKQDLKLRPGSPSTLLDRIEETLHELLVMPGNRPSLANKELAALPARKMEFINKATLTNKDSVAFALKLSLCATLCYIFYFAVDWPGISTCCGTVLIVGLTNSGAMKQKFLYRFIGSTLGGALGLAVESFLLPNIDSLTGVVLIVASVVLVTAYVAQGRRFSYIGMQMCFSFYLVAITGAHAPTALAPARDRLIGILIALFVMWVVFDQLWPVRSVTVMREALASALRDASGLFRLCKDGRRYRALLHRADILREDFGKTIANLQTLNDTMKYEFGKDRELYVRQSETMLRASLAAVALFWNELVVLNTPEDDDFFRDPELIEMRQIIAEHLEVMANALVRSLPVPLASPTLSVRPELVGSPRFGEYVRNALSRLEEVSNVINELDLQVRGLEVKSGAIPLANANS